MADVPAMGGKAHPTVPQSLDQDSVERTEADVTSWYQP